MYRSLKIEQGGFKSQIQKKAINMKEKSNTTHFHIPLSCNCYGSEGARRWRKQEIGPEALQNTFKWTNHPCDCYGDSQSGSKSNACWRHLSAWWGRSSNYITMRSSRSVFFPPFDKNCVCEPLHTATRAVSECVKASHTFVIPHMQDRGRL